MCSAEGLALREGPGEGWEKPSAVRIPEAGAALGCVRAQRTASYPRGLRAGAGHTAGTFHCL